MTAFEELPEHRLSELDDDQLIAYMREARDAGMPGAMKPALGVLVYGYWDVLISRARIRLPAGDVEDVVAEAVMSAIASAFDGRSVGEFRSWLHTILTRRVADYYEAGKRRPKTTELPGERDDDEVWGVEPAEPFAGDALYASECVREAYSEVENPAHRSVLDLYVFGPHSAGEAAELAGGEMTEANVHQIASRFQKRFRELLDEGDTSG